MKKQVSLSVVLTVALVSAMPVSLPSTANRWAIAPKPMPSPTLINACLITGDVDGLAAFYGQVLQLELHKGRKTTLSFEPVSACLRYSPSKLRTATFQLGGARAEPQRHSGVQSHRYRSRVRTIAEIPNYLVKGPTN